MTNKDYLISYLSNINKVFITFENNKVDTIRGLMNITMPLNLSEEFYTIQDLYLQDLLKNYVIFDTSTLKNQINIYQGDITKIKSDAIVNACNSNLLGCFRPLHGCIDNAIHSYAGLQVRRDLIDIMHTQGHEEDNGKCKVTKAYNLPSKYIFHTVGPIIVGNVTEENEMDLKNCYLSCLRMANLMKLNSIVFCSISTGVYSYPKNAASKLAIKTVKEYLENSKSKLKVVFNTFSKEDTLIYERNIK